jgi:hypothetical protein
MRRAVHHLGKSASVSLSGLRRPTSTTPRSAADRALDTWTCGGNAPEGHRWTQSHRLLHQRSHRGPAPSPPSSRAEEGRGCGRAQPARGASRPRPRPRQGITAGADGACRCSMCLGMTRPARTGERLASTSNRNFEGRGRGRTTSSRRWSLRRPPSAARSRVRGTFPALRQAQGPRGGGRMDAHHTPPHAGARPATPTDHPRRPSA